MANSGKTYGLAELTAVIAQGDHIWNADHWPGDHAERAADVSNAYLCAIAVGQAVIARELDRLTETIASAGGV